MIHFLLGLIVSTILIGNAWSKCEKTSFSYLTRRSILTTDGVPLIINGKPACYHQAQGLAIASEEDSEYEITTLDADYENVPDAEIYQFIHVEKDSELKTSKVNMMSVLCSGEHPVGADALSALLSTDQTERNLNIFISTGLPAEDISLSQIKKAKAKVYDSFLELYEEKSGEDLEEDESSNIYIPNILTGDSNSEAVNANRKLYSAFFGTTGSSLNPCSKKYLKLMQDFLIENAAKTQPFPGIEIKKKRFSNKYRLKVL